MQGSYAQQESGKTLLFVYKLASDQLESSCRSEVNQIFTVLLRYTEHLPS